MNGMHERLIFWTLNGAVQQPVSCSEGRTEEMLRGLLFGRGMVPSPMTEMTFVEQDGRVHVAAELSSAPGTGLCPVESGFSVPFSRLLRCNAAMAIKSGLFGTHMAVVYGGGEAVIRDDIGRHNAIDKAIAGACAAGLDLSRCLLGTSGRVSVEILYKAVRAGIPVVFTNKYPSDLAMAEASRLGVMIAWPENGEIRTAGRERLEK